MSDVQTATVRGRRALWGFLLGNGISLVGNTFALIAIPWFVIQTTDSAARTGITGMVSALPALMAGLIGGVLVDRLGGRVMSVVSDIVSGIAVLMIPLLHQTVGLNYATLLALVFLGALLDVPGVSARRTMLPELGRGAGWRDEKMNAAFENSQGAAFIVGPLLAGGLIGVIGTVNLLWFTGLSFGVSAIAIALYGPDSRLAEDENVEHDKGFVAPMLSGIRYVFSDSLLITLALSLAMLNFLVTPFWSVVMPVQIEHTFGTASRLGILISLFGIGNLAGGAIYGAIGHRLRHIRRGMYIIGAASFPAYLWLVVVDPSYAVLAAGGFMMGMMSGPINPMMVTVRMERIPRNLRGRVFASFSGLTGTVIPLGMLFAGWVLEVGGIDTGMKIIASIATGMVVLLAVAPSLRQANDHSIARVRSTTLKMTETSE